MKQSVLRRQYRKVAPVFLLALAACSSNPPTPQPPLLVDSELGRPLANTQRNAPPNIARERANGKGPFAAVQADGVIATAGQ